MCVCVCCVCVFLVVPWVELSSVIVAFPRHTHLFLFLRLNGSTMNENGIIHYLKLVDILPVLKLTLFNRNMPNHGCCLPPERV